MLDNVSIAEQINRTIESIWISLEKEQQTWMSFKLNNQQHVLLTLIIRNPSSSPTELADKMEISKSAISQQLSKLEKDGYIVKTQHTDDKRAYSIELGEKGLLYKKECDVYYQQMLEKYYLKMSSSELATMLASLNQLQVIIEQVKREEK